MSLGKWITNKDGDCTGQAHHSCGKTYGGMLPPSFCAKHEPSSFWTDKEEGPARAMSNGQKPQGYVGIYEKQPGPAGVFAPGFSAPPPLAPFNTNLFFPSPTFGHHLPPLPPPPPLPPVIPVTAPGSVTVHASNGSIGNSVHKLRTLREEEIEIPKRINPQDLLAPLGCKACGSQEKNRHRLMCPQDPARKKKSA